MVRFLRIIFLFSTIKRCKKTSFGPLLADYFFVSTIKTDKKMGVGPFLAEKFYINFVSTLKVHAKKAFGSHFCKKSLK